MVTAAGGRMEGLMPAKTSDEKLVGYIIIVDDETDDEACLPDCWYCC